MTEFEFVEGRALVELGNGYSLSILNQDRTAYINQVDSTLESMANLLGMTMAARAEGQTYEVAQIDFKTERCVVEPIEGWEQYVDEDLSHPVGQWLIYSHVPRGVIEDYIEQVRS